MRQGGEGCGEDADRGGGGDGSGGWAGAEGGGRWCYGWIEVVVKVWWEGGGGCGRCEEGRDEGEALIRRRHRKRRTKWFLLPGSLTI